MNIEKTIQTTGLTRNTIDKYYTKPNIVEKCIQSIKQHMSISEDDIIIEPSAGNGSFIDGIKTLSKNNIFYDVEPENIEITEQDYLQIPYMTIPKIPSQKIHVIGNPPFGRQSSLAIKFIKKSCEFCNSISFILPKSFKKNSMKKCFPTNYHMVFEYDIPDNSFLVDNKEYNVPCVFQIWEKREGHREIMERQIPNKNYRFVKIHEDPDISFRRVGVYAGKIDRTIENKSPQSHYFIKFTPDTQFTDEELNTLYEQISTLQFDCKNNTVGPKSISKQEVICLLNPIFDK